MGTQQAGLEVQRHLSDESLGRSKLCGQEVHDKAHLHSFDAQQTWFPPSHAGRRQNKASLPPLALGSLRRDFSVICWARKQAQSASSIMHTGLRRFTVGPRGQPRSSKLMGLYLDARALFYFRSFATTEAPCSRPLCAGPPPAAPSAARTASAGSCGGSTNWMQYATL
jgi:hypothetical protein